MNSLFGQFIAHLALNVNNACFARIDSTSPNVAKCPWFIHFAAANPGCSAWWSIGAVVPDVKYCPYVFHK